MEKKYLDEMRLEFKQELGLLLAEAQSTLANALKLKLFKIREKRREKMRKLRKRNTSGTESEYFSQKEDGEIPEMTGENTSKSSEIEINHNDMKIQRMLKGKS